MSTSRLKDKVVCITGSSPNINGGIAYGLAEEGAKIVCTDIRAEFARGCAKAINDRGGQAIGLVCDVTREDQVKSAIKEAEAAFGPIDILVNGAMIQIRKGLLDLSVEELRRQTDVIVGGTFLFSKHVARSMIANRRKGNIIVVLSTEAHQGNPGNIGYGTAKGALMNFTRCAAMELAPHGIRVNSLSPTGTDPSEAIERAAAWGVDWQPDAPALAAPSQDKTQGNQGIPLGQRPSPRHYARAVAFLVSDDAEMITGFDLRVDGGTISRYWRWNPGARILPADQV